MKIGVGSLNPSKMKATKAAFEVAFGLTGCDVIGAKVSSGVSAQPMSDEETLLGARNRAKSVFEKMPELDFAVGLEGGLCQIGDIWFDRGWVVVLDKYGNEGIGASPTIIVPGRIIDLVANGIELGFACDKVFQKTGTKTDEGYFGLMTRNVITRESGYRDGVIMALARFLRSDLF